MTATSGEVAFQLDSRCDVRSGIVSVRSCQSVEDTVERIKTLVSAKHAKVFGVVDHAAAARDAGFSMPPTVVLIFGNPHAGTPLMLDRPCSALDLPFKILVAKDTSGAVWMSYIAPRRLQLRFDLPDRLVPALEVVEAIVASV